VRLARLAQQRGQLPQFLRRQVAELAAVAVAHHLGQLVEQDEPARRDLHLHQAPVLFVPLPRDQPALVQAVEQAGDVGRARDQPAGQGQRRQRLGVNGAEQAQGVVLLRGQPDAGEELVLQHPQPVIGAPQIEERFLLGRIEPDPTELLLAGGRWHVRTIHV
jgi:hypothetical protein